MKEIAINRKAHHDYIIEETYEAGISLVGTELKSLVGQLGIAKRVHFLGQIRDVANED